MRGLLKRTAPLWHCPSRSGRSSRSSHLETLPGRYTPLGAPHRDTRTTRTPRTSGAMETPAGRRSEIQSSGDDGCRGCRRCSHRTGVVTSTTRAGGTGRLDEGRGVYTARRADDEPLAPPPPIYIPYLDAPSVPSHRPTFYSFFLKVFKMGGSKA